MPNKIKKQKLVNKIKPKGLSKNQLGGGEKLMDEAFKYGDAYHADMPGSTPESDRKMFALADASDRLYGTGLNPEPTLKNMKTPIKKALVGDQGKLPQELKEKILAAPEDSPVKMYDSPVKYSEPGFKMRMGSKEVVSEGNFNSKDLGIINASPMVAGKMMSEESPITFKGQSQFKKEAPSQAAWAVKMADKRIEQNAQGLQNALSVASAVTDVAKTAASLGGGGGGKDNG
jgi:hypothetical protein